MQVLQATNRPYILPSLRYLLCEVDAPELLSFLSPTLREVKAYFKQADRPAKHFRSLVGSLPLSAPHIMGLSFHYDMSQECLESVSMLSDLKQLYLNNSPAQGSSGSSTIFLSPKIFKGLPTSTLSRLSVHGDVEITNKIPAALPAFSALKEIDLRPSSIKNAEQLTSLFRMAAFPNVTLLKICNYDFAEPTFKRENWQELVRSMVQATPNLQSLKLRCHGLQTGLLLEDVPEILTLPLLSLEESILDVVTVADISSMATAWPKLRHLYLGSRLGPEVLSAISLHFTALQHLDILYDVATFPELDTVPILSSPVSCFQLRVNPSWNLPPCGFLSFALFIDKLYPYIRTWKAYGARGVPIGSQWQDIGNILSVMHLSKVDQRVRETYDLHHPRRSKGLVVP